ncbi:hypothetical protein BAY02_09945 [Elizabethkingia anophelis]|nr:hypothetical protein BAY02_09945 [Elizabethkingia anophelis]
MQYRPQLLQDVKLIHKLFTMKNLSKLTFALIALMLLFTACSKDDDDNSLTKEKKLVSIVFPPGSQGKQMVANYRYDDQGRLIEIVQENPYLVTFTFTYMLDGRVEKIKVLKDFFDQKYIDYTFFYESESKIPNRIRYSGAVPTYTADVVNIDNTLFWNNEDGDEFVLEGVNTTNNTFQSLVIRGITYTPQYNTQIKNGLATQADLNIPLAMTEEPYAFFAFYASLPLNSQPITRLETSDGQLYNWQYETDAVGYITKTPGGIEYRYQ